MVRFQKGSLREWKMITSIIIKEQEMAELPLNPGGVKESLRAGELSKDVT
jgi:hypothetical protein